MPRNEEGLPPEGDFDAIVQMTEIKEMPDYLFVEVTVTLDDEEAVSLTGRINLTEKAAGINRSFFHAIGFDPDGNPTELHENPFKLKGNKTRVRIEHKPTKNGDSYARISKFLTPKLEINDKIKQRLSEASAQLKAAKKENTNG